MADKKKQQGGKSTKGETNKGNASKTAGKDSESKNDTKAEKKTASGNSK